MTATPILAIRSATADDAAVLRRLAALDSRPLPMGALLLGVVDGEVRAALEPATGRVIADPFHATADVVALLELRAEAIRAARVARERAAALGALPRPLDALRALVAPAARALR